MRQVSAKLTCRIRGIYSKEEVYTWQKAIC